VDHFVDVAGAVQQQPCPAGTHQPDPGESSCQALAVALPPEPELPTSPWMWLILAGVGIAAIGIGVREVDRRGGRDWNRGPWRR
jgi:hypothetical protein